MLEPLHDPLCYQLPQARLAPTPSLRRLGLRRLRSKSPDGVQQFGYALPGCRYGLEDWRAPFSWRLKRQVRLDGGQKMVRALPIGFVDDEDVRNFHDAGLERLHVVARPRHDVTMEMSAVATMSTSS